MPKITFLHKDGRKTEIDAPENWSIMQVAVENGIDEIEGACGGAMACATCHCYIDPAWEERVTAEDNEKCDEEEDTDDKTQTTVTLSTAASTAATTATTTSATSGESTLQAVSTETAATAASVAAPAADKNMVATTQNLVQEQVCSCFLYFLLIKAVKYSTLSFTTVVVFLDVVV